MRRNMSENLGLYKYLWPGRYLDNSDGTNGNSPKYKKIEKSPNEK